MSTLHIIKIGGNIIDDPEALTAFLQKFSALEGNKILVHGGGKIASRVATDMGIPVQMIEGRRVTDEQMLNVVTMVYAGLTNKHVVAELQHRHCNAIGLCGADANAIQAVKRPVDKIDYGFVGDLLSDSVNVHSIARLLEAGFTPVFSAITHDGKGKLLNTNADTIASSLAVALSVSYQVSLVYCFDKNGVLSDVNDEDSVIDTIRSSEFSALHASGIIHDGMIPKLFNAFDALSKGVSDVYIGHARHLHLYQQQKFGTRLIA